MQKRSGRFSGLTSKSKVKTNAKEDPHYLHTNPHVGADLGHTGNRISRTALADGCLQSARGKVVDAETSVLSVPAGRLPHPDVVSSHDGHGPVGLHMAQRGRGDCCVHLTYTLSCASDIHTVMCIRHTRCHVHQNAHSLNSFKAFCVLRRGT